MIGICPSCSEYQLNQIWSTSHILLPDCSLDKCGFVFPVSVTVPALHNKIAISPALLMNMNILVNQETESEEEK